MDSIKDISIANNSIVVPSGGVGIQLGGSSQRRLNVYQLFIIGQDAAGNDAGRAAELLVDRRILAVSEAEAALRLGRELARYTLPENFRVIVQKVA